MMKRLFLIPLFVIFSAGIALSGHNSNSGNTTATPLPDVLPGQFVVKFHAQKPITPQALRKGVASHLYRTHRVEKISPVLQSFPRLQKGPGGARLRNTFFVTYSAPVHPVQAARLWAQLPDVEYAEPLYIHRLCEIPDDPLWGAQDYLQQIAADKAWDIVKGEQREVVIAIVDGGTEIGHPDLQANLWTNRGEIPGNNIDDDDNGFIDDIHGWNFATKSNDPTGLSSTPINANHGTMTAGLAAAVTNNARGIAGVSWNAKLMAINAGSANRDTSIAFGYYGILYAANNGADIINLSWGDSHAFSQFEKDIIKLAIDNGATVIAAAGNENSDDEFYPANYENVFSVAAVTSSDRKASFSNYGAGVDVSAPGVSILSTSSGGSYGSSSGTSFASPIVAGVAALVKALHPTWNGIQVGEQVRISADNIDELNPLYAGKLGYGRVNAWRAVADSSFPSIRIANIEFSDQNDNGIIEPGELVEIRPTLLNYLHTAQNLRITLAASDPYVSIQNNLKTLSELPTLEETPLTNPFDIRILENAPQNHTVRFTLLFETDNYHDSDTFEMIILPNFANIFVNNISTTITNIGRIGFGDTDNQTNGVGFSYKGGSNLLFEGAIILGRPPGKVEDAARGILKDHTLNFNQHFVGTVDGQVQVTPGMISDQESFAEFSDLGAINPIGVKIKQNTYAWNRPGRTDFIVFKYTISNESAATIDSLYFGIFFDWDMDGETYETNVTEFDESRKLGYVYDTSEKGPDTYVGLALLSDQAVSFRAIYNDQDNPNNPSWGIYDGFEPYEKWQAISGGTIFTKAGPADISHVLSAGPLRLFPQNELEIGFALAAGDDLHSLQTAVDTAKTLWDRVIPRQAVEVLPDEFTLYPVYPNPVTPGELPVKIRYALTEEAKVSVKIYNILGQLVTVLADELQTPGYYPFQWNGRNKDGLAMPSGVYLITIQAGEILKTRKFVLVR